MAKVLIVDDAQFMRLLLKDTLVSLGHTVVGEAQNGGEGFDLYKSHRPDLVTMDLVMPNVTGLEGLKLIREFDPSAKVIVVTAIDQRESLMEAIKLGAMDFIVKPFDEDRVANAIKKALG